MIWLVYVEDGIVEGGWTYPPEGAKSVLSVWDSREAADAAAAEVNRQHPSPYESAWVSEPYRVNTSQGSDAVRLRVSSNFTQDIVPAPGGGFHRVGPVKRLP